MPNPKRQPHVTYRERASIAAITPTTTVSMSLMQLLVVIGVILSVGGGYAFLVWGQSSTARDVGDIKKSVELVTTKTETVNTEQDRKREAFAKDIVTSFQGVSKSVNDLALLVAQQQAQLKVTNDTMAKIVDRWSAGPDPMLPKRR